MFNRLRNADWSWVPGLPSSGPAYSLWAVDPDPRGLELSEHAFIFLVEEGSDRATLLGNQTAEQVVIEAGSRAKQVEKYKTRLGGRLIPVRSCALLPPEDGRGSTIPEGVTGTALPPRQFTPADIEQLDELL